MRIELQLASSGGGGRDEILGFEGYNLMNY